MLAGWNRGEISSDSFKMLQSELQRHFSLDITFLEELFFLPLLTTFHECDSHLDEIPFRVDLHRNERRSHFLDFGFVAGDLILSHEELSFTLWLQLAHATKIFGDMDSHE